MRWRRRCSGGLQGAGESRRVDRGRCAAAVVYWRALGPLGRLLHRREGAIMQAVTVEQE